MSLAKNPASRFRVGDWVAFDFGPRKLSAKIVEDRGRIGVRGQRLYRVQPDVPYEGSGDTSAFDISEIDLEEVPPPVRQSFRITYVREGSTNNWRASAKKESLLKGVKSTGVVIYSTARREGEVVADDKFVNVTVLIEVDPRSADPDSDDHVETFPDLIQRAESLADETFLTHHPRAQIRHEKPI